MDTDKTFITLGNEMLIAGKDDESELLVIDPTIHTIFYKLQDGGKFGARKIAVSAANEQIITQSYGKSILSLWNFNEKTPFAKISTQEKLECITISNDEVLCLGGSANGFIFVWNACSGEILTRFQASTKAIFKVIISPDGLRLIVVSSDAKIQIFNFDAIKYEIMKKDTVLSDFSPEQSFFAHTKGIVDACIFPGAGDRMLTASNDCTVKFWCLNTGKMLRQFGFEERVTAISTDYLGLCCYVGLMNGTVHKCIVGSLENSAILTEDDDNRIHFDSKISDAKAVLPVAHTDYVSAIAYLRDSAQIVTAGAEEVVHFSNLKGEIIQTLHTLKKKITFFDVTRRPATLYRSSLHLNKGKKSQEIYAQMQKVKSLSGSTSITFPIKELEYIEEASAPRKKLKVQPLFPELLLRSIFAPIPADAPTLFDKLSTLPEPSAQSEEIRVLKERLSKLLSLLPSASSPGAFI